MAIKTLANLINWPGTPQVLSSAATADSGEHPTPPPPSRTTAREPAACGSLAQPARGPGQAACSLLHEKVQAWDLPRRIEGTLCAYCKRVLQAHAYYKTAGQIVRLLIINKPGLYGPNARAPHRLRNDAGFEPATIYLPLLPGDRHTTTVLLAVRGWSAAKLCQPLHRADSEPPGNFRFRLPLFPIHATDIRVDGAADASMAVSTEALSSPRPVAAVRCPASAQARRSLAL